MGVDPSFVEKDWHAIRMTAAVASVRECELQLVFSGGTSLSKGFGLIQRFSEDLDFKVLFPKADIGRSARRRFRAAVLGAIRSDGTWTVEDDDVRVGNESRFFRCEVGYPPAFIPSFPLRAGIRLEVTVAPPVLPPEERALRSFVAEARREYPEVARRACVAPAETAADKLSALTWRVLARQRGREGDDVALVRHLHDLAALEIHAMEHPRFPEVARQLLDADASRSGLPPCFAKMTADARVAAAFEVLEADPDYRDEYERFVGAMCYANVSEIPTFESALDAVGHLGQNLN